MPRNFTKLILAGLISLTVSCASKKKADEEQALSGDATISTAPMDFNAAGSDSGAIQGLSTINFAYDSSALDNKARRILSDNANWMRTNSRASIQIEGHCDSRGSVEYNLALGERRAKAVRDYLISLGIDKKRLSVISYGKEKPLELGDTEAVYARNRRANFVPLRN
jgi:peptidoglycan-associated lipoprotein